MAQAIKSQGGNSAASVKGQGILARKKKKKNKLACPLRPYAHFRLWRRSLHICWGVWSGSALTKRKFNFTGGARVSFLCTCRNSPPLASVSEAELTAVLVSPASAPMLRSRLHLVFSIPPTVLADWLGAFAPALQAEPWLDLTPWLPAPVFFGPRALVAPCCWVSWFTLGICDCLSLVTSLPWLSLLSGCIWSVGNELVKNSPASLSVGFTLLESRHCGEAWISSC